MRTKGQSRRESSDALGIPGQRLRVQGLDIHYKRLGEGRPVILIHGIGGDWREWQENVSDIALDHAVFALDMPGFGLSQPFDQPLSLPWSVAFLTDFMDLLEIPRASMIGHSLGGIVALAFALSWPDRVSRLALVDSVGFGEMDVKAQLYLPILRKAEKLIGKKQYPRITPMSGQDRLAILRQLSGLKPDTVIMWGQNDPYLPVSQAELAHSLIPSSTLHVFSGCGHAPHRESPEGFNQLIRQFLGRPDHYVDRQDVLDRGITQSLTSVLG